jgi:hypothetical protein
MVIDIAFQPVSATACSSTALGWLRSEDSSRWALGVTPAGAPWTVNLR